MSMLRRLLGLSLVLLLAITSQALAVARGEAPAAGYAVYCIGGSMVTVAIDADGHPVSEPHLCPDAVAGFAVLSLPQRPWAAPQVQAFDITRAEPVLRQALAQGPVPQARGPPSAGLPI